MALRAREVFTTSSEEATLNTRGFKLIQKLGQGSYAKVYLGEFTRPSKNGTPNSDEGARAAPNVIKLACKVIDAKKAPPEFVKKFLPRELEVLLKLKHPHVIYTHSIFKRQHKYYIFMRHAERGDLLEFILRYGPIAENQARIWANQIGLGIQYLHTLEIAHRDLKCENILVTQNYNVKIADFGFSRFVVDEMMMPVLSKTFCGSLQYAAPEIIRGSPYNPKRSDIWAFGVVMFTVLNKSMPFDNENAKELYQMQTKRRWRFRTKVMNQISEECKTVIKNMLEPTVSERWTVEDVISSPWISMDVRLRTLTADEFSALTRAQEQARSQREDPFNVQRERLLHITRGESFLSSATLDIKKSDLDTMMQSTVTDTSTIRKFFISSNQLRSRSVVSRPSASVRGSARSQGVGRGLAARSQKYKR